MLFSHSDPASYVFLTIPIRSDHTTQIFEFIHFLNQLSMNPCSFSERYTHNLCLFEIFIPYSLVTMLTLFINLCNPCWLFDTTALSSTYLIALMTDPPTEDFCDPVYLQWPLYRCFITRVQVTENSSVSLLFQFHMDQKGFLSM